MGLILYIIATILWVIITPLNWIIVTFKHGLSNKYFFERSTFTNDVTIPSGYDLCYLISRLDGKGTNLYNVKISGYVE